jgi:hypothetical protein
MNQTTDGGNEGINPFGRIGKVFVWVLVGVAAVFLAWVWISAWDRLQHPLPVRPVPASIE